MDRLPVFFRYCGFTIIFTEMYSATINGKHFEITSEDNGWTVNGQSLAWEMIRVSDGYFHLLFRHKSIRAEIVKIDSASKSFTLKINGHLYTIELKDKFDLLLEKMGMTASAGSKINNIKAPMPGLILDLKVGPGDPVKTGDALLILEAMKMENIIKSSGEGVVRTVKIKKGESVEKGQVLIEF
jgi:biotin carboxyl carrier protein